MKKVIILLLAALAFAMVFAGCTMPGDDDANVPVTNVQIRRDGNLIVSAVSMTINGPAITLTATVLPNNATNPNVSWSSINPDIASVSGGLVTAISSGSTTITATADGRSSNPVTITVLEAPTWGISLDAPNNHIFPNLAQGYSAGSRQPLIVIITNYGSQPTGTLAVELSGSNAESFAVSPATISSIPAGLGRTFTVTPNTGLSMDTYTAIVTVSGGEDILPRSFDVSFTVTQRQTTEPTWLPEELSGAHPYGGTWTRRTQTERIYHTNFSDPRELVNELIGVVFPGYAGTEITVGNNFGAMLSFFQSQGWTDDNRQTRITLARSYALSFYLYFVQLRDYLVQRGNIVYSLVTYDNSFDISAYRPYSTVTQVSSRLWIYEMNPNTVAVSAGATVNHGSGSANQRTYMNVFLTIARERHIGNMSGWIYVFTHDDGEVFEYDFRTVVYF